jgi:PiT family inorganic phosphate transporter
MLDCDWSSDVCSSDLSTTHTIAGAIAGSGAAHNMRRVRWDISINLAVAWVLTIPASALIASACWWLGMRVL